MLANTSAPRLANHSLPIQAISLNASRLMLRSSFQSCPWAYLAGHELAQLTFLQAER